MRRAAVAGLLLLARGGASFTFEPPYSLALPALRDELQQCSRDSGYGFGTETRATVPQLSRMCDNAACSAVMSALITGMETQVRDTSFTNATNVALAYDAFGQDMLNYCWFFRTPDDGCPKGNASLHVALAARLHERDDVCRNETYYSFQFDDNSDKLLGLGDISVAAYHMRKVCTIPACADLLSRLHLLSVLDPCVKARIGFPGNLEQRMMVGVFDSTCRMHYPELYPRKPRYYFQPGPSLPLHIPNPTMGPPTVAEPRLSDHSSSSADSEDVGLDEVTQSMDVSEPTTTTAALAPSPSQQTPLSLAGSEAMGAQTASPSAAEPMIVPAVGLEITAGASTKESAAPSFPPSVKPAAPTASTSYSNSASATIVIPSGALLVVCVGLFAYFRKRRHDEGGVDGYNLQRSPGRRGDYDEAGAGGLFVNQFVPRPRIRDNRLIGTGGNAVVYLVQDTQSGRLLASKRLIERHVTKQAIADFVLEIELVSALDHPCIVSFVGASWTNRTDIQALFEYMDGGDLRSHLDATRHQTGTWTNDKLQIAIDIAEALVYVHQTLPTPVVHRDLKSRNVLLSSMQRLQQDPTQRRAKLSDFGVAREQSAHQSMTTGVGTSRWLAPEVIIGGGVYDSACDIYSFGVVLSELDTHRVPFADYGGRLGDGDAGSAVPEITILTKVAMDGLRPTFSPSCPSMMLELARCCLKADPKFRPTASEVATTLKELLQDEMIQ